LRPEGLMNGWPKGDEARPTTSNLKAEATEPGDNELRGDRFPAPQAPRSLAEWAWRVSPAVVALGGALFAG
jgi:hypothetical protein